MAYRSPIGARRVKTDLKTFENIFVSPNRLSSRSVAATATPITSQKTTISNNIKTERCGNRLYQSFVFTLTLNHLCLISHSEMFDWSGCNDIWCWTIDWFWQIHRGIIFISLTHCIFFCIYLFRSQLPARATRLLNRSRLNQGPISSAGSDSPRSIDSFSNRRSTSSRPSSQYGYDTVNSSPDEHLFMLDKTLRNSMIQDVLYCKQQLIQLRSILQDVSTNCAAGGVITTS